MTSATTIARPYAKAILALAKVSNAYKQWSTMLEFLSNVVLDKQANALIKNLVIPATDKAEFINSVGSEILSQEGKNLVKELAHNKRLLIIPELYDLYEELRSEAEQHISLKLTMAAEITDSDLEELSNLFATKIKGQLAIEQRVDSSFIGGGMLKIGDRVLDSTVRGKLKDLYKHLTQ
jgi:F-type H+-transporting ATPase subunit delta